MTVPLDPSTRRTLQRALNRAFPDAHVQSHDVDAFALALARGAADPGAEGSLPPELAGIDWSACAAELADLARAEHVHVDCGSELSDGLTQTLRSESDRARDKTRYYWVEATHARQHPAHYGAFTGQLPMVRVRLPANEPRDFLTAIGSVEPEDHLIATVGEANEKFGGVLGHALTRLDLITPPRQLLRFGAVSVLLGYRDASMLPSCYILEAGTATGHAKVVFLGTEPGAVIDQYTGYKPTPFSCSDNAYTGSLTLENDNPKQLSIKARKIVGGASQPPYMEVCARFVEEGETLRNIWSGLLIARAASIVLARQLRGLPDGCEKKGLPP